MIAARLLVDRGSAPDGSEDWGAYEFLALPSPADRIMVIRDGEENFLTVLCVHHNPTLQGGGGARPTADVVTKWTGKHPKLR